MTRTAQRTALALTALIGLAGCGGHDDHSHGNDQHEDNGHGNQADTPTNRIAIPPVVRRNLGITFGTATYRPVAASIPVPGHFEPQPSAQHHYPLPTSGRVTVHVEPLQSVERGQLLFELDAPAWRDIQGRLVAIEAERLAIAADLAQAQATSEAAGSITSDAGSGQENNVYSARIQAAIAAAAAIDDRLDQVIAEASTLTGIPASDLIADTENGPAWRQLQAIPVQAVASGVVRQVDSASGTWAGEGTEVIHVVSPSRLRFRGRALQADVIDDLREGQTVRIAPPEGRGADRRLAAATGTLRLGVTGDATTRTVDVFVDLAAEQIQPWMRPEVTAMAGVMVAGDPDMEELAIPTRAIIQDGLDTVFFRRDPRDPDQVIRTIADLGPSDGNWVTIYSGLAEGDEVVIDGIYQLKLATTGQDVTAGHFHADGTWHDGEH